MMRSDIQKPRLHINRFVHRTISETGRISVPADFRKAIGIRGASYVIVELADDEIRIRTLAGVVDRAQCRARELLGGRQKATVDDFIRERHADAEPNDCA